MNSSRPPETCNRVFAACLLLGIAALPGCNSNPPRQGPQQGEAYGYLYDGQPDIVHGTLFPVASAEEAMRQGDTAASQGNLDLALFRYVQALQFDLANHAAFFRIGTLHARRGNHLLAERAFHEAHKLDDKHPGTLEGYGLVKLKARQYAAAKELLAQAIALEPERWKAQNALGIIADLEKRHEEARAHYLIALKAAPNAPWILNNIGYSSYLSGNWNDAMQYFHQATKYDPKFARAWMNLGLVHTRRAQFHLGLESFMRVMDKPAALNNIGYICLMEGKYALAREYFSQAIQASPSYHEQANNNMKYLESLMSNPPKTASLDRLPAESQAAMDADFNTQMRPIGM